MHCYTWCTWTLLASLSPKLVDLPTCHPQHEPSVRGAPLQDCIWSYCTPWWHQTLAPPESWNLLKSHHNSRSIYKRWNKNGRLSVSDQMSDSTRQETLSKMFRTLWTKPTAYTPLQMKLPPWLMWWIWRSLTNGYCLKLWHHKNGWYPFASLKQKQENPSIWIYLFPRCFDSALKHYALWTHHWIVVICTHMDMSQNLGPINPHVSWVISFMPETSYLRCLSYHLLPSGKVFFSRFPRIAEGLTEKECERSNERIKWGKTWDVVLGSDFPPKSRPRRCRKKIYLWGMHCLAIFPLSKGAQSKDLRFSVALLSVSSTRLKALPGWFCL